MFAATPASRLSSRFTHALPEQPPALLGQPARDHHEVYALFATIRARLDEEATDESLSLHLLQARDRVLELLQLVGLAKEGFVNGDLIVDLPEQLEER